MKGKLLSIFTVGCFFLANAQTSSQSKETSLLYAIQLGTFEASVKQADFDMIRSYAYIYKRDGVVFAGTFGSEEAAEPILAKIKAKGFDDASLISRSLKLGKPVYIIQIATKSAGEPIAWKNYARVGELFTIPNAGQVRIVHGAYEDKNDANAKLKQIIDMGFSDAFIRTVKDLQLNPVTDFETGEKTLPQTPPNAPKNSSKSLSNTTDAFTTKNIPNTYNSPSVITIKRKSVVKLQDAIRELGLYGGLSDGIFGKQTQILYERTLKLNRRLATYNELAQKHKGFEGWEDARLLLTITRELSVKDDLKPIFPNFLTHLPSEALSPKDASAALDWHTALWKKLEVWSSTGQYNDQVYKALKVAYYRTLAHLEDYYAAKGITGEVGTATAVSVLKTLISDDFEGFN